MAKRQLDEPNGAPQNKKRKHGNAVETSVENPVDTNGVSQCFRRVRVRMYIYVAAAFASNPIEGIQKEHLDPLILRYDANASGIVVSYSNVRLLKRKGTNEAYGKILNESPFSYFWITAELLVWFPQQGDIIEGWVSVQSPGHIALLIHDTFNATVKRSNIPDSWEFVPQEEDERETEAGEQTENESKSKSLGYWVNDQGERVDGKLQFKVNRFLHGGRAPLVLGSLLSDADLVPPQYHESKSNDDNGEMHYDEIESIEREARALEKKEARESEKLKPKKIKFD